MRILRLAQEMGIEVGHSTLILNKVRDDVHSVVKDIVQASPFEHVVVLPYDLEIEESFDRRKIGLGIR